MLIINWLENMTNQCKKKPLDSSRLIFINCKRLYNPVVSVIIIIIILVFFAAANVTIKLGTGHKAWGGGGLWKLRGGS